MKIYKSKIPKKFKSVINEISKLSPKDKARLMQCVTCAAFIGCSVCDDDEQGSCRQYVPMKGTKGVFKV